MHLIKKFLKPLLLTTVALIIIFPRFYQLGDTPHGLHIDEVSFAADAKSIAETGKDTWGVTMPRVFKAFGEYKAPGLTYSMAFWSLLTGGQMNNYIARLPSAIAGLTMILMLVLTLKTLIPKTSPTLLATVALVLAYSPWHFDMSRIFYEAFSATAWISISIFFATRLLLKSADNSKSDWILMIVTASIAGYYYASLRYVIIAYVIIVSFLMEVKMVETVKKSFLALLLVGLVGIGWVGDLFSDVGLNRLYYYQQKANFGSALEIDEKRQFCYLALDRNPDTVKGCYALWNKPISRMTGAATTVLTYLGTDFLFVKGVSEYGFDSEYGAYLPPLIPFYLIGLYFALTSMIRFITATFTKNGTKSNSADKVLTLYLAVALLSLVPAAIALSLNMRMAMVSLYVIAILIGYGIYQFSAYLTKYVKPIFKLLIFFAIGALFLFYTVQSTIHYWFVFTKSNDLQWTSDAGPIFNYVKSISGSYDRIVDTELHGPLAPYFYGDITTTEVHHGEYSKPDAIGFTYLIKAGKYELNHINIKDLACEVVSKNDKRRTLVISNPYPELVSMRKYESRSWNGALLLHEVYDLADVISYMERSEPNFMTRCGPK